MNKETIQHYYSEIQKLHKENSLESIGIKLPKLCNNDGTYTKDALCLILLYSKFQYPVSKEELTRFIKEYYPSVNDVQQARHLGAQKGWYIVSGTRGDRLGNLKPGEYMLHSVSEPYPDYTIGRRINNLNAESWEELKSLYHNRCVTCGSEEGKQHLIYSETITQLQQGHMNPQKPLDFDNSIPQCDWCNRAYRSYFCFDNKGRVSKINDPNFVLKSTEEIQFKIFELLMEKFG
jgi:hypothetical protein